MQSGARGGYSIRRGILLATYLLLRCWYLLLLECPPSHHLSRTDSLHYRPRSTASEPAILRVTVRPLLWAPITFLLHLKLALCAFISQGWFSGLFLPSDSKLRRAQLVSSCLLSPQPNQISSNYAKSRGSRKHDKGKGTYLQKGSSQVILSTIWTTG